MLIYASTRVGASRSSYIFKIKTFNCLRQQKEQLYCVAAHKGTHSSGFGSSKHEIHCSLRSIGLGCNKYLNEPNKLRRRDISAISPQLSLA